MHAEGRLEYPLLFLCKGIDKKLFGKALAAAHLLMCIQKLVKHPICASNGMWPRTCLMVAHPDSQSHMWESKIRSSDVCTSKKGTTWLPLSTWSCGPVIHKGRYKQFIFHPNKGRTIFEKCWKVHCFRVRALNLGLQHLRLPTVTYQKSSVAVPNL